MEVQGDKTDRGEYASCSKNTEKTLGTNVSGDKEFVRTADKTCEESQPLEAFYRPLYGVDHAIEA